MKCSTFSSSGELSESQGLNDFLNAHSTRDEATVLNKNRPQPAFTQSMNPKRNDLMNYYPPSSFGNNYGGQMAGYPGMMPQGAEYYNYEDEDFEEYGEEGFNEYEEERDPYDFEIDFGPAKKKNQAKVLDKSYEERKKALQKKKDQKQKAKEEEAKKKEEDEKRLKIEQAMQMQKEQNKSKKSLIEEKRLSTKNVEKMNFDISDALNESRSHKSESMAKSVTEGEEDIDEDYQEPKPIIYDPTEMMKYMGKSSIASESNQMPVSNTMENPSDIPNVGKESTFEASKFTLSNNNPSGTNNASATNNNFSAAGNNNASAKNLSENYAKNESEAYVPLSQNDLKKSEFEEPPKELLPKLQISTPKSGIDALLKDPADQQNQPQMSKIPENTTFLKPNITNPIETSKQDSFHTFAADNSMKTGKNNEFAENSMRYNNEGIKIANKVGDMVENRLIEMKLGHKTEALEAANMRIEAYQTELEELVRQLEASERKVMHLEMENKSLKFDGESKMRVMQEKNIFLDKITETRMTQQLSEQFSLEKEHLLLEIEKLNSEVSYFKSQNEVFFQAKREIRTLQTRKEAIEAENSNLKRELLDYQELIKDPIVQRRALRKNQGKVNEDDEDSDFLREFEFQELLIKGYQKENEKNLLIIKDLKEEIDALTGKVFKKETAIVDLKSKYARSQKAGLVLEDSKIDVMKGMVSPEVLVDMAELKDLRRRFLDVQDQNKEIKKDLDLERGEKKILQERIHELQENIEKNEIVRNEFLKKEKKFEEIRSKYESDIQKLKEQLSNYEKSRTSDANKIEELKKVIELNKKEILEGRILTEGKEKADKIENTNNNKGLKSEKPEKPDPFKKKAINDEGKKKIPTAAVKVKSNKTISVLNSNSKAIMSKKFIMNEINVHERNEIDVHEISDQKEPIMAKVEERNSVLNEKNVIRFLELNNSEIFLQVLSSLKNFDTENPEAAVKRIQVQMMEFPKEFDAFKMRIKILTTSDRPPLEESQIFELISLYEESLLELIKKDNFKNLPQKKIDNFMKNPENNENQLKKLEFENRSLKEMIMNTPKNPTRLDFEILERKLELVERAYKQKELEIVSILENLKHPSKKNYDESKSLKMEVINMRNQMERERKEFDENLKRKNREIQGFKEELGELLGQLEQLRS